MNKRLIVALIAIAPALILSGCGGSTRRQLSGHELKLLAAVDPREISPGRYLVGWVLHFRDSINTSKLTLTLFAVVILSVFVFTIFDYII